MNIIPNGAKDLSTPMDYKFGAVYEEIGAIPTVVDLNHTVVQNQGLQRDPSTSMACTCFSVSHATNIENFIETSNLLSQGEEIWGKALLKGASLTDGWYVKSAVDLIKELGYIAGYTTVVGLLQIKQALYKNQVVCTGSNQINWALTYKDKNNIASISSGSGHAFCIIGYNDTTRLLKIRNSYGPDVQDGGHFYIRYEDVGCLFTCFALTDFSNPELLLAYKAKIMQENVDKCISLGLTTGSRLDDPISRRELFAVMGALANMIEKKTGSLK